MDAALLGKEAMIYKGGVCFSLEEKLFILLLFQNLIGQDGFCTLGMFDPWLFTFLASFRNDKFQTVVDCLQSPHLNKVRFDNTFLGLKGFQLM